MTDSLHILILGAENPVGRALTERAQTLAIPLHAIRSTDWDLTDRAMLLQRISDLSPSFVLTCLPVVLDAHSVGMTASIAKDIADICQQLGIVLVHLSDNNVFAHQEGEVFKEDDEPKPQTERGVLTYEIEQTIRQRIKHHLILRVGWLFSTEGEDDVTHLLALARKNEELRLSDSKSMCPTSACDVAFVMIAMVQQSRFADLWGVYHYCSAEQTTLFKFAEVVVAEARQHEELAVNDIVADAGSDMNKQFAETTPKLVTKKILYTFGIKPKPWRPSLTRVLTRRYKS